MAVEQKERCHPERSEASRPGRFAPLSVTKLTAFLLL